MIPNGNFATCPIFARATVGNHWEMRKEVVHLRVALDTNVTSSTDSENWKKKKGAQKIKFNHNLKRLTFHESSQTLRYCIGILFIVIYLNCNTPSSLIIADAETQNQLALLSVC